jgi:hypothetical protein
MVLTLCGLWDLGYSKDLCKKKEAYSGAARVDHGNASEPELINRWCVVSYFVASMSRTPKGSTIHMHKLLQDPSQEVEPACAR